MASKLLSVKLDAMRHVQRVALELFEADGFDGVSVTDIAAAAGVAPRSVYRYFGTKEGIVSWNETDDVFKELLLGLLQTHVLADALRVAVLATDADYTSEQRRWSQRQVTLIDATPQLRAHMAATIDRLGRELGVAVAVSRDRPVDDIESHLDAQVAVTTLFTAAFEWERRDAQYPLADALNSALDALETWGSR